MSAEEQALFLNAIPLLALGALYLAAAATLAASFWRERSRIGVLELTLGLVFACSGAAAALFGLLVLRYRESVGGEPWLALAAIAIASAPVVVYFSRWRDRALLLTGLRRAEEAERRTTEYGRRRETVDAFTAALARARDVDAIANLLVKTVVDVLGVQVSTLALVEGDELRGVAAQHEDADIGWWRDTRMDLSGQPSASASVVYEAAPVAIYDLGASPIADRRIVEAAGAKSALFVPLIFGDHVVGVVSAATTREHCSFGADELALLRELAAESALALETSRSVGALGEALERERRALRVARGFYRIAAVLGEPLSISATLDAVAQAANEALGGSFAAVLMPRGGRLALAGEQDLPTALASALADGLRDADAVLANAAADERVLASPAVGADDRLAQEWRALAERAGYASLLAAPIRGARDESGLVLVFFAEPRAFTDNDLELSQHLAHAARAALERSSLYEQERSARSLAQQLARTGSVLATELDPAAVLEEVVRQAPGLVGVEAAVIRVLEDDELVVSAAEGEGVELLLGARSPATAWLSGDVIQSRSPLAVPDVEGDERLLAVDALLQNGYRAYLGVPLAAPEAAIHGVLAVYARRPRPWRDEEIAALGALAANASAALSNAELYQRVALEKERNEAILANIADGIVAVDRDGRVVLWNNAAEQITGVPADEALGRTPLQVLGRNLEADGTAAVGDRLVSILRGGEEVWLSLTEAVMRDPLGVVAGRIYAFRDISADRLVEQMKSDFVSTVSQELRRPLTSIYGFAETLLRQDVLFGEEERRTFLGYIASESERLTAIVDALLNVARLDTGDLQINLAPTDVAALVPDVLASVGSDGHRFDVDLPDEPLAAAADPEKLRQVLSILVENAVKFSPEGGTVTVAARKRRDAVEVTVADEGIGIPQGEQQRIFRKFYRREGGAASGAGLGLFIARGLVAAMGGRIWVASNEGRGSSFTFELPVAQPAPLAATADPA